MNSGFFEALSLLGDENSVETEILVEKVKSALLKAIRKAYPDCEDNIRVDIDPANKKLEMYLIKTVVDDEPIDYNEINIDEARTIDPNAYLGGTVEYPLDAAKFGRAAAQSAKQSIKGDLREINRENILSQFQDKENECITAKVSQVEPGSGTVTVVYDKTELYLFRNEQIPGEHLKEGDQVKVYVTGIVNKSKKPIIKISRAHRDLVKRLFELSGVPEEKMETFDQTFEAAAGEKASLLATNIASVRKFNIETPDVVIKVNPERTDLIETRIIDGKECLVITVNDHIEVNGVNVRTIAPQRDEDYEEEFEEAIPASAPAASAAPIDFGATQA